MNMKVTNNDLGRVAIGNNLHRDGLLTLAAVITVAAGTVLMRNAAGDKYEPFAAGAQAPSAIMGYEIDETNTIAGDNPVRPIISGIVDESRLVVVDGTPLTPADIDALKANGIVALPVQELNYEDNQAAEIVPPPVPLA